MRTSRVLTLMAIGFLAGLVTALSPCVLPVLPGILAASSLAAGGAVVGDGGQVTGVVGVAPAPRISRRRPYLIVAGLLTSFTLMTLLGATLVSVLGVPDGLLRAIALVTIIGVGLGLLVPGIGHQLEKVFSRFPSRGPVRGGSAFVFGLTLGVVFVPCAGPVLAAITVLAASEGLSAGLVVLTLAFAAGLAVPLLLVARLGVGAGRRLATRMPMVRRMAGAVFVITGLAVTLGLADAVQRAVPGYVSAVQQGLEDNDTARGALDALRSDPRPAAAAAAPVAELTFDQCAQDSTVLADCGTAPELTGIVDWLNSPGDAPPLSLAGLRAQGKVVLVDFWTYSCINCQRTLPYVTAWDAAYRDQGLTVIGVHSPEFAFERDVANVAERAKDFGVEYPIAIDNDFRTWRAYDQRYWPAHYLIDRTGTVRQVHYGEGAYAETEALIRELLAEQGAPVARAASTPGPGAANRAQTPETYLGYTRARAYTHAITRDEPAEYTTDPMFGRAGEDRVTLMGEWTVRDERIDAGRDAGLILDFSAADVFLVLGGEGTVTVREGPQTRRLTVSGAPTLYALRSGPAGRSRMGVYLDQGLSAYAFTFG
jgi:cytochrome c biogenesis protein CcdA/thiol-disulfide isomerase/thioredoxin